MSTTDTPRAARPRLLINHPAKPRMAVIAPSVPEVVRFAGGWLVDQGLAGWDVNVLTTGQEDPRPLRILGASAHDLDTVLASLAPVGACLDAIAIPAYVYDSDERVRRMVFNARRDRLGRAADVRLWGEEAHSGGGPVRHRLSLAARAFKAQAMAAASIPAEAVTETEVFRTLGITAAA
jgi:hypothetical protein